MVRLMVRVGVCFALLACLVGCPGEDADRPDTVPVTGTVTYNGNAVANASVTFSPASAGGDPAIGVTDSTGGFELKTQWGAAGAVPGSYVVTVTEGGAGSGEEELLEEEAMPGDDPGDAAAPGVLPTKYQSADTSDLKADVKAEGENNFPFELTD